MAQSKTILIVVTHSAELAGQFPLRYALSDRTLKVSGDASAHHE